ncbi:hypothetical protein ACJJTC_002358 [Scirpophaga incertulas]
MQTVFTGMFQPISLTYEGSGRGGAGAAAWARRWWRALAAEALATALLVLLGVATLVAGEGPAPLTHPALAFGFVVLVNVEAFGPASGAHMNPAVTLAALLQSKLPIAAAAAYVVAQSIGATAGFAALKVQFPLVHYLVRWHLRRRPEGAGCTQPADSPIAAAVVEAILTGSLVLLASAAWAAHDPARPDHAVSIKFALGIAGLVYAGGPLTGASLNPARSFGPAVIQGFWKHHWVSIYADGSHKLLVCTHNKASDLTTVTFSPLRQLLC